MAAVMMLWSHAAINSNNINNNSNLSGIRVQIFGQFRRLLINYRVSVGLKINFSMFFGVIHQTWMIWSPIPMIILTGIFEHLTEDS